MGSKQFFYRSLTLATSVIHDVRPQHISNPTPCREWDVEKLIGHMLYELAWIPDMVSGKTMEDVGETHEGDLVGKNLQLSWLGAAERARFCVEHADLKAAAHLSFADTPNEFYIRQVGGDLLIHAWDLGQGIGKPVNLGDDLAQMLYDFTVPQKESLAASGLFAPPVPVPKTTDIQTKLLALFGRKNNTLKR